ncbi:hypothetical protein SAMD00019534_119340 [Acytostelium subglobosum LB1]|uniref:hypothetical protein n=1 Tax=Acytostelium subglobosum LB1 TaxID=1410327 RepID=UPI000644916E|nr:hypothetical protein SAMD00019534_119340 [Acytostelium subglobosum LB1]GAM28758.1 hypothetical protein SAMD00019534_119340 [Acytostelium subglobosum LB1]|eukprot:XP_012748313.1 hypothetical protein SAMD00019534_119340 [Acytostelium subglobosum LB1]
MAHGGAVVSEAGSLVGGKGSGLWSTRDTTWQDGGALVSVAVCLVGVRGGHLGKVAVKDHTQLASRHKVKEKAEEKREKKRRV